jgi:iron-sulfur cluster insertion protein
MILLTETAIDKIEALLKVENNPALSIRVYVQGGGCSGFSYGFTFDEVINEDDINLSSNDEYKILIDSLSAQYLEDATIDYKTEGFNSQFSINNPNVTSTCGCGSSFSL